MRNSIPLAAIRRASALAIGSRQKISLAIGRMPDAVT
jgi:hypothetical protein